MSSIAVPPRPPYSRGQRMQAQPALALSACHALARPRPSASERRAPPKRRALPSSPARASARNAASCGLSAKSMTTSVRCWRDARRCHREGSWLELGDHRLAQLALEDLPVRVAREVLLADRDADRHLEAREEGGG